LIARFVSVRDCRGSKDYGPRSRHKADGRAARDSTGDTNTSEDHDHCLPHGLTKKLEASMQGSHRLLASDF
jgi:hypothetical protein